MTDADVHVVVVAGGELGRIDISDIPARTHVIAADSGLTSARLLGLRVDIAVGDFDSVDPDELEVARKGGTAVEQFPADKDFTDLELAIERALTMSPKSITVIGGAGGRLDHLLGNVLLLAQPRFASVSMRAMVDDSIITVVHDAVELAGSAGGLLSLFAIGGVAEGVTTTGLRWALDDEELCPVSTRGISNIFLGESARVSVRSGVVLAVQSVER